LSVNISYHYILCRQSVVPVILELSVNISYHYILCRQSVVPVILAWATGIMRTCGCECQMRNMRMLTNSRLIRSRLTDRLTRRRTCPVGSRTDRTIVLYAAKFEYETTALPQYAVDVCNECIYLDCCISQYKSTFRLLLFAPLFFSCYRSHD